MMMFASEIQELLFYKTLTCFEEEFGAEKIIVFIPAAWSTSIDLIMFSYLEIRVWNLNAVRIKVKGATANFTLLLDELL